MYTEKEFKFLRALFKLLKGQHVEYSELKDFIKKKFRPISDKDAFELSYLYDKNWSEEGFSQEKEDINRMSYDEYFEKIPWQIKAVMKITGDNDPDNYEFDGDSVVEYDDTDYVIYDSVQDLEDVARSNYDPCDSIGEMDDEHLKHYVYITDTDRHLIAQEDADSYVDSMDDEDLISAAGLEDEIEALEERESLKTQVEEKTEEMEELVHKLDDVSEEEKSELEEKIADFETEIEELESKIEDLGDRNEIIERAKEEVRDSQYNHVYGELSDPVDYFVNQLGAYESVSEFIDSGPGQFDCDQYRDDFFQEQDTEGLTYNAGYSNWDEVRTEERGYVIIVWN